MTAGSRARGELGLLDRYVIRRGQVGQAAGQLAEVSEVLGHVSITITKDVYGYLLEGDKRAAAESMSQALFGG